MFGVARSSYSDCTQKAQVNEYLRVQLHVTHSGSLTKSVTRSIKAFLWPFLSRCGVRHHHTIAEMIMPTSYTHPLLSLLFSSLNTRMTRPDDVVMPLDKNIRLNSFSNGNAMTTYKVYCTTDSLLK